MSAIELRILREQVAILEERLDALEQSTTRESPAILAQTVTETSYPAAGKFFACKRVDLTGPELEGGTPVYTLDSAIFYAAHIGTTAPPANTRVIVVGVPYRKAFYY